VTLPDPPRVRLDPDATPEEAEAVRQALAALGLIEDAAGDGRTPPGAADRDP
jgi:hypothetical protein